MGEKLFLADSLGLFLSDIRRTQGEVNSKTALALRDRCRSAECLQLLLGKTPISPRKAEDLTGILNLLGQLQY